MLTLSVCNHKGGTGKTTTSIHIAAALGLTGRRVLVVDLDPQGFLTSMMGAPAGPPEASSLALFAQQGTLDAVQVHRHSQFDLLPYSKALNKQMRKLNKPTDVLWARSNIEKSRLTERYDVIMLDTAAAVTVYSLNALVASQHVLIPVTPEYQPVLGAEQTFQTAKEVRHRLNPKLNAPMFLFTQVDARKNIHRKYQAYIRERYAQHVLDQPVRTCASLAAMNHDGTTLFDRDLAARGAQDYAAVADELMARFGDALPPPQGEGSRQNEANQQNEASQRGEGFRQSEGFQRGEAAQPQVSQREAGMPGGPFNRVA
jgi:chromosome partitioning protein